MLFILLFVFTVTEKAQSKEGLFSFLFYVSFYPHVTPFLLHKLDIFKRDTCLH